MVTRYKTLQISANCKQFEGDMAAEVSAIQIQWKRWNSARYLLLLKGEQLRIVRSYLNGRKPLEDTMLNAQVELAWCHLLRKLVAEKKNLVQFPHTNTLQSVIDWLNNTRL